jgi:exopolysaccharide biosynthesis polyprenyl glycosylphosphotransferase
MSTKNNIHFEVSERKILLRLLDITFVLIGLYVVSRQFEFDYFAITKENWIWTGILVLYITLLGTVFELYDLQKSSKLDVTFKNVVLTASVTVLFYLLTPYVTPFLPEKRLQIIYFYLTILIAIFLWRVAYVLLFNSPRFYKKVLLIADVSDVAPMVNTLKEADTNYDIVGYVNSELKTDESINFKELKEFSSNDLVSLVKKYKISEVVVASNNSDNITPNLYNSLILLLENGVVIKEYTQVYENLTYRVPVQFVGKDFYKYFPFSRSNQNKLYLFFSRTLDIIVSLIGLLFGLLFLPIIILGNLIANRGPLFYKQERVGKNGKVFNIIKFRTMIINAEKNGAQWADKNDSRITSFGAFLRNSRLDELPQFFNVLNGDMALIGPRPERPFFVRELIQLIPFYETRHIIKPGLTGWAQVKMRYGGSVDDSLTKLQYDLYYIKRRSFFLDVNVIVKTVSTILYYRGQ